MKAFYGSNAWKMCRKAYKKQVGGLCEECLKNGLINPGEVVHHKIYVTPTNVTDPAVTLSFDNLQLLCRKHHEEIHNRIKKRYCIDGQGNVVINLPLS